MIIIFCLFFLASLITISIVNTWQYTTLKIHLMGLFYKDVLYKEISDNDSWECYMLMKKGKIGELLTCKICQAHWVALFSSTSLMYAIGVPIWWFPIYCFFTIPFLVTKFV